MSGLDKPILLTDDYLKSMRAGCVPYSYREGSSWYIPPDPDPESARYAIRLFPALQAEYPELVARARLSAGDDYTPIDYATERWERLYPAGRALGADPWKRITAQLAEPWHPPLRPSIVLHPFQRFDADAAMESLDAGKGYYFGHEMGLGKTLAACLVIDGWPANFVFITCPNTAKQDPWVQHLTRFTPWLHPVVVGNTPKTRQRALDEAKERLDAGEPTALVCHYEAVVKIDGPKKTGWKPFGQWDLKVIDEMHQLATLGAARTRAVKRVKAAGTIMLSGSVMSGSAERLFVPLNTLQPKRYRSQWTHWNDRYLDVVDTDFNREVIGPKLHTLPAMRAELGEVLVVRRAKDHLSVPEPIVVVHEIELHGEQKRVYRELLDDLLAELPDGSLVGTTDGAPLLTALRRVTAGIPLEDGTFLSAKHDKLLELMESAGDSQVLAFSWHRSPTEELKRRLTAKNIGCGIVMGGMDDRDREAEIDLFKRGGYRVLGATIAALSNAANLQNAGVVTFIEESFDPVHNEQAVARAVRQGQDAHVSVHIIRAKGTVDDMRVVPAAASKAELRRLCLGA